MHKKYTRIAQKLHKNCTKLHKPFDQALDASTVHYAIHVVAIYIIWLASYCKAETTFTFYFSILTLSSAFLSINNIEMKSESGFSFAMASQPFTI